MSLDLIRRAATSDEAAVDAVHRSSSAASNVELPSPGSAASAQLKETLRLLDAPWNVTAALVPEIVATQSPFVGVEPDQSTPVEVEVQIERMPSSDVPPASLLTCQRCHLALQERSDEWVQCECGAAVCSACLQPERPNDPVLEWKCEQCSSTKQLFVVESILDRRKRGNKWHYLVRWAGFDESEDSWEPRSGLLCDEMLQEFDARRAAAKRPSKRGRKGGEGRRAILPAHNDRSCIRPSRRPDACKIREPAEPARSFAPGADDMVGRKYVVELEHAVASR